MYKSVFSILVIATLAAGCRKNKLSNDQVLIIDQDIDGTWIRESSNPGSQPADTLYFSGKNGKGLLSFTYYVTPGRPWPSRVETEYHFKNGQLSFRDYTGQNNGFRPVESFEWKTPGNEFSIKLYQLLLYISADYSVTYRKIK